MKTILFLFVTSLVGCATSDRLISMCDPTSDDLCEPGEGGGGGGGGTGGAGPGGTTCGQSCSADRDCIRVNGCSSSAICELFFDGNHYCVSP